MENGGEDEAKWGCFTADYLTRFDKIDPTERTQQTNGEKVKRKIVERETVKVKATREGVSYLWDENVSLNHFSDL